MVDLIFRHMDNTNAITINLQLILIDLQIIKQPLKPNALIYSFMTIYLATVVDKATIDCKVKH